MLAASFGSYDVVVVDLTVPERRSMTCKVAGERYAFSFRVLLRNVDQCP
jgi:hypothetical protein